MTEPTDAEIIALADETRTAEGGANGYVLPISFARAVLAKWGAPAGAGGDQVGRAMSLPGISGFTMACFHSDVVPLGTKLYTTPQPTQAQAGAVPRYRLLVRGQDTIQADDEFLREDGATWLKDPSGIFVGCMYEGTIFLPARRAIDEAHGIEGGQHDI